MSSDAQREWIVLLEATDTQRRAPVGRGGFDRLMAWWPPPAPVTLFSENRYAIQVPVDALSPPSALSTALAFLDRAYRQSGVPRWDVVRAEVVTPDELDRELAAAGTETAWTCAEGGYVKSDPNTDELLRRALHDSATGLPGRGVFVEEVRDLVARAAPGVAHAVLVLRIAGLATADRSRTGEPPEEALVELAARLTDSARAADAVARIGPCEFALCVAVPAGHDTRAIARRVLTAASRPLACRGITLAPSVSMGVATSDGGNGDGLVLRAEEAIEDALVGDDGHRLPAGSVTRHVVPVRHSGGRCATEKRT